MRFHQLSNLFYSWGWKINHEHYVAFSDYLKAMLKMDRVLTVMEGEEIIAIVLYYLTDNYEVLYKKGTWELAQDYPSGSQMYIDKMICKKFDRQVLRAIKEAVEDRFPQVKVGVYHRAPNDKCVKIYTKGVKSELPHSVP